MLVAGLGVSGFAAADALLERGRGRHGRRRRAPADGSVMSERARILDILGAHLVFGPDAVAALPDPAVTPVDLVVTSPGWRPDQPLLAAAAAAGIPVWGRSSSPGGCAPARVRRRGSR